MSRTYELSYDGTQLYETLHMTTGRNNTPLVIRFVYDQAAGRQIPRLHRPRLSSLRPLSKTRIATNGHIWMRINARR